ncbi:MAG: prepilin-type N-terminal cleavage/methylation domain-containing protein [Phycisphaerae bacterium]|nr:prepilin-type N-terminal cleavage/methylation domain-containing protein [Phycisphaerae bacterium]
MKRKGFTLIELLVVIAIIATLMAIVMPAISKVQKSARETAVKAKINSIGQGLESFHNDQGFYPSSALDTAQVSYVEGVTDFNSPPGVLDTGAHHLARSMFGADLLGYATKEDYYVNASGITEDSVGNKVGRTSYLDPENMDILNPRGDKVLQNDPANPGYWMSLGLKSGENYLGFSSDTVIANMNPLIDDGMKANSPRAILYFKARKSGALSGQIYNIDDNVVFAGSTFDSLKGKGFNFSADDRDFYEFILDGKTGVLGQPTARPYNKDTYILIAAGTDGIYGTKDDICNFPND